MKGGGGEVNTQQQPPTRYRKLANFMNDTRDKRYESNLLIKNSKPTIPKMTNAFIEGFKGFTTAMQRATKGKYLPNPIKKPTFNPNPTKITKFI
jgi:hypothetical protein